MSWFLTIPPTPLEGFNDVVDALVNEKVATLRVDDELLAGSIVDTAYAAKTLAHTGIAGAGTIGGTISGHVNPGHVPTSGWANDCVTITLQCADPLVTTTTEENAA